MSSHCAPLQDGHSGQPLPFVRWACLAALFLAEVLVLQLRFDTRTLTQASGWWAEPVGPAHVFPHLLVASGAAVLLLAGRRLRDDLARRSGQLYQPRQWWPWVVAHVLCLAPFVWLTGLILEGGIESFSHPDLWVAAWAAAGLASLACWGMAVLPPGLWLALVRHSGGPLLTGTAVGVASWGAGRVTEGWWQPLSRATLWVVHQLLTLVCPETVYRPDDLVVGTPSFLVLVAAPCSGYEGIGLVWVFLGAYLWLFRHSLRFPQALLLLPAGTAVVWLANAVRIAVLVVLGTWVSPALALGGFHSLAGWLAFNVLALGLVAASRRMSFFTNVPEGPPAAGQVNPTAAYLGPLFAILVVAMITGPFSGSFNHFYPLGVLAAGALLWYYRREYGELRPTWSWGAVGIGAAAFVLWLALEPAVGEGALPGQLSALPRGWAVVWLAFRVLGSVVTVPLAEELAFRGYLTRRLLARDFEHVPPGRFSWFAFLASSLLFGLLHGRWLAGTGVGMLYALALYRRRELSDAVLAHATTNALIAAQVLILGNWSLWS